jgi:hypothetical protein
MWKTFCRCLFVWLSRITLNGFSFHFDDFIYIVHVEDFPPFFCSSRAFASARQSLHEKTYGKVPSLSSILS